MESKIRNYIKDLLGIPSRPQHPDMELGRALSEGFRDGLNKGKDHDGESGDTRYNKPKKAPKASDEMVEETINDTEIYKRAKELILNAQKKQVAYGIDKYPEPLNPDSWDTVETIDHIIDESVDRLHYLVMLRIKMENQYKKPHKEFNPTKEYFDKKAEDIYEKGSVNYYRVKSGLDPIPVSPAPYDPMLGPEPDKTVLYADNGPVGQYATYQSPPRYHSSLWKKGQRVNATINMIDERFVGSIETCVGFRLQHTSHIANGTDFTAAPKYVWDFDYDSTEKVISITVYVHDTEYLDDFFDAVQHGLEDANSRGV